MAEEFEDTHRAVADVVAEVRDGETVYAAGAGSFPLRFVEELARRDDLRDVTLGHPMRRYDISEEVDYVGENRSGGVYHVSDFTWDGAVREGIRAGRATYRPNNPHEAARTWARHYSVDMLVTSASPPDRHGYVSLGVFGGWTQTFIEVLHPRKLVLEINARQPRVLGMAGVHLSEAYAHYDVDYELPQVQLSGLPSREEIRIAEYVAEMIPDGATLQLGVGGIPDAVGRLLIGAGKQNLGIHSENLSDTLVDLIEAGVVDNSRKRNYRGVTVCTLALGTDKVYQFLDDNPRAVMLPVDYVNDPAVIASNPAPISVNATLAVDLTGQCASESIGPRHYSGTGGQWEFIYGANHAPEGRGIVTLPSSAKGGTISTIVSMLPQGSAVTVPRNDSPTIVTEYGVADLRGRTLSDRARALIAIAHPDYRKDLKREAEEMGLIP